MPIIDFQFLPRTYEFEFGRSFHNSEVPDFKADDLKWQLSTTEAQLV
ncbi:hypothetical protein RM549_08235 [Salegentibacter sp. F188]|uniref:Uncharacterized protein n=1 Tax=Autumnicola patrickiae TaxID=3075591 RepID=A0ABU3E1A4_9FLAO|nr:hypothetical protein [Salegentibacter sp. F188]MDT0689769.1 hypothetical protein [Salegentibacter sp. F188]